MGKKSNVLVGIDIGTTKTIAIVGEVKPAGIDIIGVGITPAKELRKGGVVNIDSTVEAIKKGAFDFLEKPVNGGLLVEKVQSALARSRQMHAELLTRKTREARLALLTPKERQIAELVVEGKSSPKIAEVLDISVRTVENHRARLMEKLHVESTIELVKMFL